MAQTIKNIVIQITQDQHESEERFVVGYDENGTFKTKIVTYAELSSGDKTKFTNLKNVAVSYMPAE